MTKQFIIKKVCNEDNRPPYSYKLDEYFEEFVQHNILSPLGIVGSTDWKELLSIMYFKKEAYTPDGINIYEPTVIEEEKIKFYPVGVNLDDVYASDAPLEHIISLYYQVISMFFLTYYKSISRDLLIKLKDKLDWDYLLSLPYPAPIEEQKYVGD